MDALLPNPPAENNSNSWALQRTYKTETLWWREEGRRFWRPWGTEADEGHLCLLPVPPQAGPRRCRHRGNRAGQDQTGPPKSSLSRQGDREGRLAKTETPRRRLGHPGAKPDAAGDIAAGRPCGQRLSQLDVWGPWPQQLTCQQRAMGSVHICREALYEAPLDPKWILHSLESRWCHVSKSPRLEFAFQADGKSVWIQRADEMG